jgi:uncharacterized membrane protein
MQLWLFGAGNRVFLAVSVALFAVALVLTAAAFAIQDKSNQK